jgi:hypothetical protein
LVLRSDIDHLWPELWDLAGLSHEELVLPGELRLSPAQAASLLAALGLDANPAEVDFRVSMVRIAGRTHPIEPMRLLEHKNGGTTRTSCDPGLWEPVYYPPAEGPPAAILD